VAIFKLYSKLYSQSPSPLILKCYNCPVFGNVLQQNLYKTLTKEREREREREIDRERKLSSVPGSYTISLDGGAASRV
jgi:hypothetical protein